MPSFTNREAVPPVERISMPSAESPRANSARPVLSETLIRARATVMTRLHTTGGMKRCARRRDYSSSLSAAGRGSSSAITRSFARPRISSWRTRSRVRFMLTPTSSSVVPARSATSSAQVSASSHSSLSGKFIFTDPVRGLTSTYRLYLQETYGQGRSPSAQSPRVLGRLASSPAISVCSSGSRPPAAACWRKSRAISLRLMVRARWRGLSSGSSTTGRTFLFGSLMKASSLPGLFPCGDFGDRALHVLDELVRVLAALGEETVQLPAPRRAQLALVRDRLLQRGEELVERPLHAVQLPAEEDERVTDVLQGHPLVHERLDHVDAAHRARGIEALRAAVLALLAHAPAPREQAELDVLAEGRLRELHAARREEADDLDGGDPLGVLLLEHVEVVALPLRHRHPAQGAAPSYAPAPPAML